MADFAFVSVDNFYHIIDVKTHLANSNYVTINPQYSRKKWMLELCDVLMEFYPREISKITERMEYFERVHKFWLAKPDE
jgi:hypothetical protein